MSTCGLKPMSSIRSASSRTSVRTRSSETEPALDQILEAAGRGDEDVSAARALGLARDRRAAVDGRDAELLRAADQLELAGDLRAELARRDEDRATDGSPSAAVIRSTIGRPKAKVLPDPVGAFASTSRPASASGRTSAWIGKGVVMLRFSSAFADFGAHAERAERNVLHRFVRLLGLGFEINRSKQPEGGPRSSISRDGRLPSVVSE